MKTLSKNQLGQFTQFNDLTKVEQTLVQEAWSVADRAYIPLSNFPVGAAILAQNSDDESKSFSGCNVENRFMGPTICAERNAITTAIAQGYNKLTNLALVLKHYHGPGSSPCGQCRQVMIEFGAEAIVLQVADKDSNVQRYQVADLLPGSKATAIADGELPISIQRAIKRFKTLRNKAYAPYTNVKRSAIFVASNAKGKQKSFVGTTDENAAYGASAAAELVAMRTARSAGYHLEVCLIAEVKDIRMANPIEGHCLQVLREFGPQAKIVLVDHSGFSVITSIDELLPDSFGPQALA